VSAKKRVAVLISGRGSNMIALIEASRAADYPAEIVGVLSNRADAGGLAVAAAAGIATAVVPHRDFATREQFEAAVETQLVGWGTEIVCLAGFMRLLTAEFTTRWLGRMINIHPSLLPLYKGLHTHERAIADGASEHGCTVHFVTPGMDEGPVILRARVLVRAGDSAETLAARVLVEEHRVYPQALAMVARGEAGLGGIVE